MKSLPANHSKRMNRVRLCLAGLSLGDSFGERFVERHRWTDSRASRQLPPAPWKYTDDTEMALAVAEVLDECAGIDQDLLVVKFVERYALNPYRGYGAGAQELMASFALGSNWREAAGALFSGQGSLGNGGAMRAGPIGAYFADEGYEAVAQQARLSAEVTHSHPEGIAGAIATAIAAAWAAQRPDRIASNSASEFFATLLKYTPEGLTRVGIGRAANLSLDTWQFTAAEQLGNGSQVSAPDTVPFCLWIVARHLDDFTEALWSAVHVGGDMDTNCAIVGGILALAVDDAGLPTSWLRYREPLS